VVDFNSPALHTRLCLTAMTIRAYYLGGNSRKSTNMPNSTSAITREYRLCMG